MSNSFTVPDTPLTRRLSEMHAEQRSRRDNTQRIPYNSPTLLGRSAGAPEQLHLQQQLLHLKPKTTCQAAPHITFHLSSPIHDSL